MIYIKHTIDEKTIAKYLVPNNKEREGATIAKSKINLLFANKAVDIHKTYGEVLAVYLDGLECRTTRCILDTGLSGINCIPVNDNATICDALNQLVPWSMLGSFNSAIGSLPTYMVLLPLLVWYDSCQTIIGDSKNCTPIEDVGKLLDKVGKDFTFAITFSSRAANIVDDYTKKKLNGVITTKRDLENRFIQMATRRISKKKTRIPKEDRGMNRAQQMLILENAFKEHGFKYDDSKKIVIVYPRMTFMMVDLIKVN